MLQLTSLVFLCSFLCHHFAKFWKKTHTIILREEEDWSV